MITVDEALEKILSAIPRLEAEEVSCTDAAGRILAQDIVALRSHPAENQSAMDGYAVRRGDLDSLPATLEIIGEAPAGSLFPGELDQGQAVRIFTGGAMPGGADTVVMQEDTEAGDGNVTINSAPPKGKHVRLAGNDFRAGEVILRAGERLTARALGFAVSAAGGTFPLARRPRVALLATGDELVPPGIEPEPGQLVGANSLMLEALFAGWGAEVIDLGIAGDSAESLRALAQSRTDFDMLVTIGGASVGDYDLVQSALGVAGLEVDFWKIAVRPGKPLIFGQIGGKPMIGLPGNPVSAFVCATLFVLPAIDAFQGASQIGPRQSRATLDGDLPANGPRQAYLRASLSLGDDGAGDDGALHTAILPNQDSAALSSLATAQAFIIRPAGAAAVEAGQQVPVLLLDAR
ncbi:MAG: molybdopterin molybdotransferase MoeA [Proteobacteria bacterium]|nr:molybdopterin molybdotransferase MoeA [Pseudomonadota bacterium]